MAHLIDRILSGSAEPAPMDDAEAWWAVHRDLRGRYETPIERALVGGFVADRPAFAFASGYQEALLALLGSQAEGFGDLKIALTATERRGNHPRDIRTTLAPDGEGFRLSGEKSWAMLGPAADRFLVVATTGADENGRNRLAAVLVPAAREGVSTPASGRTSPIVPEIPHTEAHFDNVAVSRDERLSGDGYERYLKPFRTLEDLHVHVALLAWLLQVGRRSGWSREQCERFLPVLLAALPMAKMDPSRAATHVALAGLISAGRALVQEVEGAFDQVDAPTRERWNRDRALLGIAQSARERRRESAWESLS